MAAFTYVSTLGCDSRCRIRFLKSVDKTEAEVFLSQRERKPVYI